MNNFLIVGLGNPGVIYKNTRHNFGFIILTCFIKKHYLFIKKQKLGNIAEMEYYNNVCFFLQPTTCINNSGKSVKFWMNKKSIKLENILIISDDFNLKFGRFRLRGKGSSGGHNGLKDIEHSIGTANYPRLRFGIGNNYYKNNIDNYVLGNWNKKEKCILKLKIEIGIKIILSFITKGLQKTMNYFN